MLMRLFFSGGKPGSQNFGQILKLYNRNVLKSDKLTENYSEQGEWDRGFSDHYQSHLKVLVDEFETERIAAASLARKKLIWLTPLFAVIPVIGWQIILWELNGADEFAGIGFYFIAFSYALIFWYVKKSIVTYQNSIKNQIFPRILSFIGDFTFSA